MSNTNANKTEIQEIKSVPNDRVPAKVEQMKASTRYVSHRVIPENGETSTIEVTVCRG